jgi:hypothetical protein
MDEAQIKAGADYRSGAAGVVPAARARLLMAEAGAASCAHCREQARKSAADGPHPGLALLSTVRVASLSGSHAESIYRCSDCSALLMHCDSRTQAPPHWLAL